MALLSEAKRKQYFKDLGLGNYNATNIKKFQKGAFPHNSKEWDGAYGTKTDRALRHWWNVRHYTKNFRPEEFKCDCGGKYCTGYPSYMKPVQLKHLQTIRDHYGKPMKVTCGLRCKKYNDKVKGSIKNSKHLSGYATDFYMQGVTDTLANRKKAVKYIKGLLNHNYTYGNGINSSGASVSAPYMGNALHTDTNEPVKKTEPTPTTGAQKITAKAKEFAWPYGTKESKYKYPNGSAKTAYKLALKNKMNKKAKISQTDCGYFASTCVRSSGVAGSFLALPASASKPYPAVPKTMTIAHKGAVGSFALKAGDVIRYRKTNGHQHVVIYIGSGYIAHASRGHAFPRVSKSKPWNNSNVKKSTIQVLRAK